MWLIDRLAEEQIETALARGELDDLPGSGAPLKLDDDSAVPESMRTGYRLLKNAGVLPPEMQLRGEILTESLNGNKKVVAVPLLLTIGVLIRKSADCGKLDLDPTRIVDRGRDGGFSTFTQPRKQFRKRQPRLR